MSRSKIALLVLLLLPVQAMAGVDLPWTSTLSGDTPWDTSIGAGEAETYFSGFFKTVDIPVASTYRTQICTAANYSSGGGGMGFRQWHNTGGQASLGAKINLASSQNEIWIRWYMRYQAGFTLSAYHKTMYLSNNTTNFACGPGNISFYEQYGGTKRWDTSIGFTDLWGSTSDGSWHCFEVHIKGESAAGVRDGELEVWIDGEAQDLHNAVDASEHGTHLTACDWGMYDTPITHIQVGHNVSNSGPSTTMAVDYDDFAINNTGYIGPLGESEPDPPAPPTLSNVTISGGSFR